MKKHTKTIWIQVYRLIKSIFPFGMHVLQNKNSEHSFCHFSYWVSKIIKMFNWYLYWLTYLVKRNVNPAFMSKESFRVIWLFNLERKYSTWVITLLLYLGFMCILSYNAIKQSAAKILSLYEMHAIFHKSPNFGLGLRKWYTNLKCAEAVTLQLNVGSWAYLNVRKGHEKLCKHRM